ncbi:MAG: tripartite tricarboxylate transporter permease [Microbacteriaceae bacterium]
MEQFDYLMQGFAVAMTWENLLFALIGCLIGTALGLLPGIGSTAGIAILLPLTISLEPATAIIMLAAIFYGCAYGGTITSVLLNIPGESETAVTVIDGYPMTLQGRGGIALTIAGIGSFIGGTFATLCLVLAAPFLAQLGLMIGPPEYFGLILVGIALLASLVGKSVVTGLISAALGLLIGLVGLDPVMGTPRFTFGSAHLLDGIHMVPVLVGIFGLGELLYVAQGGKSPKVRAPKLREMIPTKTDFKRAAPAVGSGALIGTATGLVPGITSTVSTVLAYTFQKKTSKFKHELGSGAIEGVASPETANNAHVNSAFVPLFFLGIPSSASLAVLAGAFLQNGLVPGPRLFTEQPLLVWSIIASLFIGNALLLILNVPLVGMWTRVLAIPYPVLVSIIFAFIIIGSYAVNTSTFDLFVMIIFGFVGLVFRWLEIPLAPLVLTLILGPLMELSLRQSMQMSGGDLGIFIERPIALTFLCLVVVVLVGSTIGKRKGPRKLKALVASNVEE